MGRQPGTARNRALIDRSQPASTWFDGALADLPERLEFPLAWRVRLDRPDVERDARAAALTSREVAAFARTGDAPFRMLRRRLAKALLAKVAKCHPREVLVTRDGGGALRVEQPGGWHLSVAGQAPFALIGVSRTPIGVDIEPHGERVPEDVVGADERAMLAEHFPRDLAPLVGWVAREAHGKATGRARQLDPREIGLERGAGAIIARSKGSASIVHVSIDSTTVAALALPMAISA